MSLMDHLKKGVILPARPGKSTCFLEKMANQPDPDHVLRDPHLLGIRYRQLLRTPSGSDLHRGKNTYRLHLTNGPESPSLETFLDDLLLAEASPDRIFKKNDVNFVFKTTFGGQPILVKRFDLRGISQRIKYLPRRSRGKRAWAASLTLAAAGIPIPQAIGFLSVTRSGLPLHSYAIHHFLEDTVPARRWIKAQLHRRPGTVRKEFSDHLLNPLKELYSLRIYHADTKASNLLVRAPEDPTNRTFFWIDLDCMSFDQSPTQSRILRNLVQLNGSVGSKLSDEDRIAFLHGLADIAPWVEEPWVDQHIRTRTRTRLTRELRGECGP